MSAVVKPNQVAFDGVLICAVVGLIAIGTIMVTSASVSIRTSGGALATAPASTLYNAKLP